MGGTLEIPLGMIHKMPSDLHPTLPPIPFQPLSFLRRITVDREGARVDLKTER
jgi:hypothetical protein